MKDTEQERLDDAFVAQEPKGDDPILAQFGEMADNLKVKHGLRELFILVVPESPESPRLLAAYIRRPQRAVMGRIQALVQSNPITAMELLLENCWVEGDPRIKTDDTYFLQAMQQIGPILDFSGAVLKKK